MKNKVVLGFVGEMASGKGAAVAYLKERYGVSTFRFSSMLRDILTRLYLEHSRDNMIHLSVVLRREFGEDVMSKVIAHDAEHAESDIVAVEGIRRVADVEHLRKLPNFKLVSIEAPMDIRYKRSVARGENSGDSGMTYEEFEKKHSAETEASIPGVMKQADVHIANVNDLPKMYEFLDKLVTELQNGS